MSKDIDKQISVLQNQTLTGYILFPPTISKYLLRINAKRLFIRKLFMDNHQSIIAQIHVATSAIPPQEIVHVTIDTGQLRAKIDNSEQSIINEIGNRGKSPG